MAGKSVSPGAALLRSSRMFSMPAPIPPPPSEYSSAFRHYSPTATVNYPTHLTVTTTQSSRSKGDWGFKRPFPLKTTTTTTYPLVRVKQVDSIEHVTDFQSASDHTITLHKFQELNLPLTVPLASSVESYMEINHPKSVFEEETDVTALDAEKKVELANQRWKFSGPWLAGMTDGDFDRYITKEVRGRRTEFRHFLKKKLALKMQADQKLRDRELREAGKDTEVGKVMETGKETEDGIEMKDPADEITEDQFIEYLRELRADRMSLYNFVSQFLDLAPIDQSTVFSLLGRLTPGKISELERGSPYAANGPPITHPSAGLSYLRTRNFEENHPMYGPQKHHAPVNSRVLKPANSNTKVYKASIGVAGFVANTPNEDSMFNATRRRTATKYVKSLHEIDIENYGGSKIYTSPTIASVDSSGKICIAVKESDPVATSVAKEAVGEESVFEQELKDRETPEVLRNPSVGFSARQGSRLSGSARSYGLGPDGRN
ncbi:mitochondrial ribosomal protein MRP51 [Jackrogersella minutella]|nr:mitochondrial ribosomal protein MRP51 [Jackrogersella minutella]